jgi:hypothetical protein
MWNSSRESPPPARCKAGAAIPTSAYTLTATTAARAAEEKVVLPSNALFGGALATLFVPEATLGSTNVASIVTNDASIATNAASVVTDATFVVVDVAFEVQDAAFEVTRAACGTVTEGRP